MKKRIILLASASIISMISVSLLCVNNHLSSFVFANTGSNNIADETLIFDANHRNPITKHNNEIVTSVNDYLKYDNEYLCKLSNASAGGTFKTETPIQSISRISITWSARYAYRMYFRVGSTIDSNDVYDSGNMVAALKNFDEKTTVIDVPTPEQAHYFSIRLEKFDTTTCYFIRSVEIVYSCSYSI